MNKIYNEEVKERFLATYDNEDTQKTLRNVFYKSHLIEDTLEKDLYNFNLNEIGKVIKNANPYNKLTAKSFGRFISNYISWAISEGLRESNINPIKSAASSFYNDLVDKTKKIHYSYEEFLQLLSKIQNGADQAFLFLIFSGINGKSFSQLRELKISDINWDTNEVYVKERDKYLHLNGECMKYLDKAIREKTYFSYNINTGEHNEKELVDSEFLFKNVQSPRTQFGMVNPSVFYTRLNHIKSEFDLEFLTPNGIRQSGIIKMCVELYKEFGKLEYEQFAIVGDRYEFATVQSGEFTYYNTTLLKEFVNPENIKELYGIDIKF